MRISDLDAVESHADIAAHVQRLLAAGGGRFESMHRRKNGTLFNVDISVTLAPDNSGSLVVFLHDISEFKRVEKALRKSEQRYSLAIDAVADGIWDRNVQSGEAVLSPRCYAILGYEEGGFSASYEAWRKLVHPEDIGRVEEELSRSIQADKAFVIDMRMQTKAGAWLWVSTRGRGTERDINGSVVRMVGAPSATSPSANGTRRRSSTTRPSSNKRRSRRPRLKSGRRRIADGGPP